jgi:hypothetical protein
MNLILIGAGLLLLFLGRKLFWISVAALGFIVGMTYAPQIFPDQPQTVIIIISLIVGLLGALITSLLQRFAVGISGLAAGAYIVYYLLQNVAVNAGQYQWLIIVAGGIIGAILAGSMFDWALILLTGATGATLITEGVGLAMPFSAALLVGLFILGVIMQTNIKVKE